MKDNNIDLSGFQSEVSEVSKNLAKMGFGSVFMLKEQEYINDLSLYTALYHEIPNVIPYKYIQCTNFQNWLITNYGNQIKDVHYKKIYLRTKKDAVLDDVFFFLFEDLMIYLDTNCNIVRFLFRKTDITKVNELIEGMKKFKQRESLGNSHINLLVRTATGMGTKFLKITKPKLNIIDNYNDDFLKIHQAIIKRLSKKSDKGLVLLHGKPGTGKTSYIRYLISKLNKSVFFLPPNMASAITNPDLISILIDNPNSVFVIEDAENIIMDREKEGNSPVSALLNISDGLLADCLNIQIICSFNTDISKIDNALMRKGRLIAKYEFKELELEKAKQLSQKLGFNTHLTGPMTLAAIYNQTDQEFQNKNIRPSIGFRVSA
jgi:hypothetical protein